MYDPYVKLVDVYKDGVWKCKVEYKKVLASQTEGEHWKLNGARFDYENNPGSSEVQQFQFTGYPDTVEDSLTRIDI